MFLIKIGDQDYEDKLSACEEYKTEGNKCLSENKFALAVDCFTKAIDLKVESKKNAIYYANRAFIQIKLENFGLALEGKLVQFNNHDLSIYRRKQSIRNRRELRQSVLPKSFC